MARNLKAIRDSWSTSPHELKPTRSVLIGGAVSVRAFSFTKFTYFYLSGRLDTLCHVPQSRDCSQQKIFHLKHTQEKEVPRMICLKTQTFMGRRSFFFFFLSRDNTSHQLHDACPVCVSTGAFYPDTTHTALVNVNRHRQTSRSTMVNFFGSRDRPSL